MQSRMRSEAGQVTASGTTANAYAKAVALDTLGMCAVKAYLYNSSANSMTYKVLGYLTENGTHTEADLAETTLAGTTGVLLEFKWLVRQRLELWAKSTVGGSHATWTLEALITNTYEAPAA